MQSLRRQALAKWAALPGNVRGSLLVLLASLSGAIMAAVIKAVGQRIPVVEILLIRQICVIAIILPVVAKGFPEVLTTTHLRLHLLRGLFSAIAMVSGFTALVHIPLAEATALHFTRTLFTTILAVLVLKEVVGLRRWAATAAGFGGVLIIVRPGFADVSVYLWLMVLSAFFVSLIMIVMRRLSQLDKPATIMAYQSGLLVLILLGPAAYEWQTPSATDLLLILVVGILMAILQWSYIQALKVGETAALAPMEYSRLLFATAIGFVYFAEIPTLWTVLGAGVIIGAALYTIRHNAARGHGAA